MLTDRSAALREETQDGLERPADGQTDGSAICVHERGEVRGHTPVVDVAPRADVPAPDGRPHFVHDVRPLGLLHVPGLGPVEHDVRQNSTGVVGHLDAVRLTVQQLTARDTPASHTHQH